MVEVEVTFEVKIMRCKREALGELGLETFM